MNDKEKLADALSRLKLYSALIDQVLHVFSKSNYPIVKEFNESTKKFINTNTGKEVSK